MEALPGWITTTNEVSNNHWAVSLIDSYGRKSEYSGSDLNEVMGKAISGAFDIEKQISKNWCRFLYDLCLLRIPADAINEQFYKNSGTPNWRIGIGRNRIIFSDDHLIKQITVDGKWFDSITVDKARLDYSLFNKLLHATQYDQ